uniref:Uncharacterized protein n=1 Tax=Trichuris muris TaxID=70415 RepID=A0A5S6QCG1_TRIMR
MVEGKGAGHTCVYAFVATRTTRIRADNFAYHRAGIFIVEYGNVRLPKVTVEIAFCHFFFLQIVFKRRNSRGKRTSTLA